MTDLVLFTDDAAYIQHELNRHAQGVVDTFTGGINAGRRLLDVRAKLPADREFGAWCKAADFRRPDGKPFTRQWLGKLMGAADEYDYRGSVETQFPAADGLVKLYKARQDRKAREITPATGDVQPVLSNGHRLYPGDFRDAPVEPGTVDMIITDPPYPAEFLPLWHDLARMAAVWLKPQGILVALTGKVQLPQTMDALGAHLSYGWMYLERLPGSSTRILARHINQTWKPWLAYSNGPWPSGRIDWHPDELDPSPRQKDAYWWQQGDSAPAVLVDRLTAPGDVVMDPFAGAGTYPAAAARMGRQVIACEADTQRFTLLAGAVSA